MQNNNMARHHCPCHVGFRDLLERVRQLVEIECFLPKDRAQAEELCRIIAEVMVLPPTYSVQIEKTKIPAGTVAEIYSLLRAENIEFVINKFNSLNYEVKHKKSYLRTLLYNAVFEMASEISQW